MAATVHVTNPDIVNTTFASVQTEDTPVTEAVSEAASTEDSANDNVHKTNTTNNNNKETNKSSNTQTNKAKSSSNSQSTNSHSSSNSQSTNSHSSSNTQSTNHSSNSNSQGSTSTSKLAKIAVNTGKSLDADNAKLISTDTINGEKIYTFAVYSKGKVVGECEINQKGVVTGGAFEGEVQP